MDFESTLDNNMGAELELSGESKGYLKESAKWAKFLGIVGFIYLGMVIILLVGFGSVLSMFLGGGTLDNEAATGYGILFFYLVMLFTMVFFPSYFNYLFGRKMLSALENKDTAEINESFKKLKSSYKFWGIVTLVYLILSVIGILASFALGFAFM